jgi:WD40 repeat protein
MDTIKLILTDTNTNNRKIINTSKQYLADLGPYFKNLLTFGKEKIQTEIVINIDNIIVAENVIMHIYNSNEWKYILNFLKYQNYFQMDVDMDKLYDLAVPAEGFDMLLEIIEELNCVLDDKLKTTIKKNIPKDYDLKKLSDEFIKTLLTKKYYLASRNNNQNIKIWDIQSGRLLNIFHKKNICEMIFISGEELVAAENNDHNIKLYKFSNMADEKLLSTLYTDYTYRAIFSPNGQMVASTNEDGIRLWNVLDGKLNLLIKNTEGTLFMAFSPDSQLIVAGFLDGDVGLWKASNGEFVHILVGHTNCVTCMVFSPNNQIIATTGLDQSIKLWDVSTGNLLNTLVGHTNVIWSIAFSPNGQFIISGSADESIKLWNVSTGQLLNSLDKFYFMGNVLFSPDNELIVAYGDHCINIWNVASVTFKPLTDHVTDECFFSFSQFIYDDVDNILINYLDSKN